MVKNTAEKEYIEREAALNVVNGWRDQLIPTYGKNDEYVKCLETVAEHLESLHAADVRPVVLCRDCKYWDGERLSCEGLARCNTGESGIRYRKRNDFCSRGEKREES